MKISYKKNIDHIIYTMKHRKAFRKVEKQLLGHNTLRGWFHDMDKLAMYLFLDTSCAHNIHVKYSGHHVNKASSEEDYIQMVIDWECARLTKPDKPLSARDFLYAKKVDMIPVIEPVLCKLGL